MNSIDTYRKQKELFMSEYEKTVRQWMSDQKLNETVIKLIPFLEDGVVCPETWFKEGNDFRPLFILKEASIGIDCKSELEAYYQKWKLTRFDHVGDEFGDIRIGVNKFKGNNPWMRIVKLAYGLKTAYETGLFCEYNTIVNTSYIEGKLNPDNVSGDSTYAHATANENYISMVNRIAVVNIKKIAGGTYAKSELSKATLHYSKHLDKVLADYLYKQIVEFIKPTVTVFCSPDISSVMKNAYGDKLIKQFICLDGYHPSRTSTEKFYNHTVKEYIRNLGSVHENLGR